MKRRHVRHRERGSAMLVTLILIAALLAGGAVLLAVQRNATRSDDVARGGMSGLYCAEAGLNAMRANIQPHFSHWQVGLPHRSNQPGSEWLTAISHDIDGEPGDDIAVTIQDNLEPDEDEANDSDLQILVKVRCIKNLETQTEVAELLKFTPGSQPYGMQAGGGNEGMNSN